LSLVYYYIGMLVFADQNAARHQEVLDKMEYRYQHRSHTFHIYRQVRPMVRD